MSDNGVRLLLVDDEPDIIEFLLYNLKREGYEVKTALDGKTAIEIAEQFKPHLILLDIMMPEMDGIEVCEVIRSKKDLQDTLIAFLTARGEDYSQINGFDVGADDYIVKPIKPRLLVSRIKAMLRRIKTNTDLIQVGDISINEEKHLVAIGDLELSLPKKEFKLLALLCSKPGKVFRREEILSSVWGSEVIVGDRTIDVHIRKLRDKIGSKRILTVKGVGYKMDA